MLSMGRAAAGFVLSAVVTLASTLTAAAEWAPGKTVKVIVPFPAGGTADVIARILTQQITKTSNQQFVIENRPGGGTVTGTDVAARSPNDGTALLIMANSFTINPSLRPSLPYDIFTSFEPVCSLVYSPMVLAVNNASPHKTFADFVAAAKAKPPTQSVAAVGPATAHHMALEMLKRSAGIDFSFVPHPGGAPAVNTVVGNHVSAALANVSEMQSNLGTNLRPLAVGAEQRLAAYKDVPTFKELGHRDMIATAWFGIVAPAKTPDPVLAAITKELRGALDDADVSKKLDDVGLIKLVNCGADYAAYLKKQYEQYATVIKEAGIKGQ
jgi:tripartite-type tricarboxylate transporter receptor subunit TctC